MSSGQAIGIRDGDAVPPEIRHVPQTQFTAGMPIRIQATVTDDVGVSEVTLFYRTEGDIPFQSVKMVEAPGSDIYTADLPDTAGPRIQYFIQALDAAGNVAVPDRSTDPYLITLPTVTAQVNEITTAPAAEPEPISVAKKDIGSKWLWIGFGVLAAGVLASSGSGGGSSTPTTPGTGGTGGGGTTVGTGTVSITAALPAP